MSSGKGLVSLSNDREPFDFAMDALLDEDESHTPPSPPCSYSFRRAHKNDRSPTTYSPDGRIFQVRFALETHLRARMWEARPLAPERRARPSLLCPLA